MRPVDSGALQFVLYGLVGFIPAVICSWLAHEAIDELAFDPELESALELESSAHTESAPEFKESPR